MSRIHENWILTQKEYTEWQKCKVLTYHELSFYDGYSIGINARYTSDLYCHVLYPVLYNKSNEEVNAGPSIIDLLPGQSFSVTNPQNGSFLRNFITLVISG